MSGNWQPILKEREAAEAEQWEGWAIVQGSGQYHYFASGDNEGFSLCGKFQVNGKSQSLEMGNDNSPNNCSPCRKKLKFYRSVG